MTTKRLFPGVVAMVAIVCFTGCKDDSEDDLMGIGQSDVTGIYINEVCSSGVDWVELYNASDNEVSLAGFHLQDDKGAVEEYKFPEDAKIAAKGFLVLEKESHFAFGISSGGDVITLLDASGNKVDEAEVPALAEGQTYARVTDGGAFAICGTPTPGASNKETAERAAGVCVNEVFTNNQDTQTQAWDDTKDFIELYNPTDKEIDISGYSLNDDALDEAKRYTIPAGTKIKAKSFLTLDTYKGNAAGPTFGLGKKGDKVFLYDATGKIIDEVTTSEFADTDIHSCGRKTDGGSEWVVFTEVSKNASNNGKKTK